VGFELKQFLWYRNPFLRNWFKNYLGLLKIHKSPGTTKHRSLSEFPMQPMAEIATHTEKHHHERESVNKKINSDKLPCEIDANRFF
jgi:hypothetical protein